MIETSLLTHFHNEELLIGDWVDHHKKFFDHAILIDHHSTDRSREIAQSRMPETWKIVTSRLTEFQAHDTDSEVMDYENTLQGWKMTLNITEFLFCPDLKEKLAEWSGADPRFQAFGSKAVCLVDAEQKPLETPIWKNRTHGFVDDTCAARRWRYIHNAANGRYEVGRHGTALSTLEKPEFLHLHFTFSPWPECISRKMQIQTRIPQIDKDRGFGFQHIVDHNLLEQRWKDDLARSGDLLSHQLYRGTYEKMLALW